MVKKNGLWRRDDDAADIAQAKLPGDLPRSLNVGFVNGVLQGRCAHILACVNIDHRQSLCLVDNQVAAYFQPYFALQSFFDLRLQTIKVKQRAFAPVIIVDPILKTR